VGRCERAGALRIFIKPPPRSYLLPNPTSSTHLPNWKGNWLGEVVELTTREWGNEVMSRRGSGGKWVRICHTRRGVCHRMYMCQVSARAWTSSVSYPILSLIHCMLCIFLYRIYCSCLGIRVQDEVTVRKLIIVPLKGWKGSNIWEQP